MIDNEQMMKTGSGGGDDNDNEEIKSEMEIHKNVTILMLSF